MRRADLRGCVAGRGRLVVALLAASLALASASCSSRERDTRAQPARVALQAGGAEETAPGLETLTIVATSDLHGHIETLPIFAGYMKNLRRERAGNRGDVLLVDAGDMFQGTLESNLAEGAPVIAAYNYLDYAAAAVGNHEFDFGPVGPDPVVTSPGQDPRGALRARAVEATFPLLLGNIKETATGREPDWKSMPKSISFDVSGVRVGIVGVTTMATPYTTMAANFAGLAMEPLAAAVIAEAKELRAAGATIIIVAAHAGGACRDVDHPKDLSTCDAKAEVFALARALPAGVVQMIAAGHTHAGIAQEVNGIPIVESYAYGRAFGRVDLRVDAKGVARGHRIFPPQQMCRVRKAAVCNPFDYPAGPAAAPVEADTALAAMLAPAVAKASKRKHASLGVKLLGKVRRSYKKESALGNLIVDLMRVARPSADIAITNGGGLRADLPAGELTYGAFYEATPFDNRFAIVIMRGRDLAKLMSVNLRRSSGILSMSGARVVATCDGKELHVRLIRDSGKPIGDGDKIVVATSDFLASGGDGLIGRLGLPEGSIRVESGAAIRDELATVLRARGGAIDARKLLDKARPRLRYRGKRPVRCP